MSQRERFATTLMLQQERPSPIEDELLRTEATQIWAAAKDTSNPGSSRVNKVALASRKLAFHKAAAGVNDVQAAMFGHSPFGVLVNESAAWMLARSLGPPFSVWVPPTVIRSLWPQDPALPGGFGALSLKMNGEINMDRPMTEPAYRERAAFWDCLVGQQDRHRGNYRFDPLAVDPPLGLIDHGYAFAAPGLSGKYFPHQSAFVAERHAVGQVELYANEIAWLNAIQGNQQLLGDLRAILEPEQFQAFAARIQRMLAGQTPSLLPVLDF